MVKLLPPNLREPLQAVILKHSRDKQFDMESQRISMHRVLLVAMGIQHAPQLSAMVAPLGIVRFYEVPMLRVARVEAYLFLQAARRRQSCACSVALVTVLAEREDDDGAGLGALVAAARV